MAIAPGTRLGAYEILSAIGAGGMGEVYRAHDTTLGRDVAIKVLPAALTADRDRVARFEREARVLASLNHPNIAAIHGFEQALGVTAIVMELVEGETLADRIRRGPLPPRDALVIARAIADALDAAHERGIVHRDLKPANIILGANGVVKVLDFGLAKTGMAGEPAPDLTHSPTMLGPTIDGMLLGTAPYMSPEQARGKPVDKRTDIWAFGCVLYEMLTGRITFSGNTVSDHIAAILEHEPDWSALPVSVPRHVTRVLRRCLTKDCSHRARDIADVRLDLDEPDAETLPARRTHLQIGSAALAAAAVALVAAAILYKGRSTFAPAAVTRSVVLLPPHTTLSADIGALAISPDGKVIVFTADAGSGPQLYMRNLDALAATAIAGTEGAEFPFFSPDGRWVAFWDHNTIKKIALGGGAPQVVCVTPGYTSFVMRTATWGENDVIFFSRNSGSGLSTVPASGGNPQNFTTPNRDAREKSHRLPDVMPAGNALVMTVATADITSFDDARIEVLTLATGARQVVVQGGIQARYLSTGHLVYARAGSLLAVPFDVNRLQVTGPPVVVAEDVFTDPDNGFANFAVSRDGSLLYAPGGIHAHKNALVWVDRRGRSALVTDVRKAFENVRFSPDGQYVAMNADQASAEIWLYDLTRTTFTRLAYGWDNNFPIWSPDGAHVTFNSNRSTPGAWNLFQQAADGTDVAERLTTDPSASQIPESWSPDGRFLVYTQQETATDRDLFVRSISDRTSRPLVKTPASESDARISPDGRWFAYQSNQSGRFEVYVQAFPGPSRRWQVSLDGGMFPIWAPNGRELFFRKDNDVMAADIAATPSFVSSMPKRLFGGLYLRGSGSYDVTRDGRFLMIQVDRQPITQLNLVQNWFAEVKTRTHTMAGSR
jgi:Tol biopolymer transport system component